MKVVLTGGGTGGHAYPALSIAEALRADYPDCQLQYFGSKNGPEARLAVDAGLPFTGLTSRKLKKLVSPDTILTAASMVKGLFEASSALNKFKADLVIGTGGYVAASVVLAQALRGGKTLILEPDVIAGRTNRFLGKLASRVCLQFEDAAKYFPSGRTTVTGMPTRADLQNLPEKKDARISLGLKPDIFTLLITGGSQGALNVNRIIADALPGLSRLAIQILHQVGSRNFEEAEKARNAARWDGYHVHAYFDDMRPVFGAADLVLSRSGASTVAELTAIGLPAILVPYPFAHADHQRYNGEFVARHGGGILVNESDLTPELVVGMVEKFLQSPSELEKMAAASKKLGKPNAAKDIAAIAAGMIGKL